MISRVGAPLPSLPIYFVRVQRVEVQRVRTWVLLDVGIGSYETKTSLGQLCFRFCDEHFMSDSAVLARLATYSV
jgi:hypothetical protein